MNDKLVRGITFENIIKELIESQNEIYYLDKYFDKEINYYKSHFDCYSPHGIKIKELNIEIEDSTAVEIKYSLNKSILEKYVSIALKENIKTIIFFIYQKVKPEINKFNNTDIEIQIYDKNKLYSVSPFTKMYDDFNEFILENVEEDKHLNELRNTDKFKLSFALGAGCSIDANISNWETLSKALGYELLYSLLERDESAYFNMTIAKMISDRIFSSFDKTSALEAIQNLYETKESKLEYYKSLQRVLYMSYDGPKNENVTLMKSICDCIRRNNIYELLTYNFDSVLEQVLDNEYTSKNSEVESSITEVNDIKVYHVHGYIPYDYKGKAEVNNFVFTDKDYYENTMKENNFTNITQRKLFNRYNMVFVGVSFTDGNLKEILRKRIINGENNNQLYAFYRLPNFEKKGREQRIIETKYKILQQCYFDTLGIKIIWVKDYKEIPDKINLI